MITYEPITLYICVDYHIVFVTKYRRNILANEGIWSHLEQKFYEITEHYPPLRIKEINHDINHVHILISIPPQITVGGVVRLLKTNTAHNIKIKFIFLKKVYYGSDSIWSDGYFVSTVDVDEQTIKHYIENQGKELDKQLRCLNDTIQRIVSMIPCGVSPGEIYFLGTSSHFFDEFREMVLTLLALPFV